VPETRFLLVGDMLYGGMHGSDEYTRNTHELVDRLGLRDRCLFLGNRDDVADLYRACDVTVLPSLFEGTPNVVLESMACGVPVIATNVSDNASIVKDGHTGYLVPIGNEAVLADRLGEVLTQRDLRRAMGRAAREWVEVEFSSEALARRTGAVYTELLSS
jgi:glycosyltransferase involved in cell wall biosynthesis